MEAVMATNTGKGHRQGASFGAVDRRIADPAFSGESDLRKRPKRSPA